MGECDKNLFFSNKTKKKIIKSTKLSELNDDKSNPKNRFSKIKLFFQKNQL